MTKELVLKGGGPDAIPAAQYIRMSTEHQRYSPDNQRAAIAAFAAYRGFEIVKTYQDSGKSGLTLSGRPALKQLLGDVLNDDKSFRAILVLDVSRWGRFQDTDQSAYYEYMCREAGVSIHYCTEPFENDGGAIASIVKHMKRVMAAEFSRELSTKVSRAQRHQAGLGFKQGSGCPLGLRRQVVDANGIPRAILAAGERKALSTHKIVYAAGPAKEVAIVRRMFELYVDDGLRLAEIARWLNTRKRSQPNGSPWTNNTVRRVLQNELYIGHYVFGKTLRNLGQPIVLPERDWVRAEVLDPMVAPELFKAAQMRLRNGRRLYTDDELKTALARLYSERGRLSHRLINNCSYLPSSTAIVERFGSIAASYAAIGQEAPEYFPPGPEGDRLSKEALVQRVKDIYDRDGYIGVRSINDDEILPSYSYVFARLGGIARALRMAGIEVTVETQRLASLDRTQKCVVGKPGRFRPRKHRNPDGSKITDDQLVAHLKRILAEHGYLTAYIIKNDPHCPDPQLFRRRLGSIPKAYALAGYVGTRREIAIAANARRAAQQPERCLSKG